MNRHAGGTARLTRGCIFAVFPDWDKAAEVASRNQRDRASVEVTQIPNQSSSAQLFSPNFPVEVTHGTFGSCGSLMRTSRYQHLPFVAIGKLTEDIGTLYLFEKDGTLVNKLSSVGHYFNDFGETGETRCHDKRNNTTYFRRSSLLGSYIVKRDSSGEEKVIVRTPFHKWLFMGPFPAWLFFMLGIIMFMFVSKNSFKRLLRRGKERNNQV